MMDPVQILNKILFLCVISFTTLSCSAQKINVNNIVDTYIDYYSSRNKIFNPSKTFLQLGIDNEEDNLKEKNIYINNNCFDCIGKINEKDSIIEYRGYKVVIYANNVENKNILLSNFKNTKKTNAFFLNKFDDNIINDVGSWTFNYNENAKISFFCNSNPMKNMKEDMKEIKQKLGIQNVRDCVSALLNDTK
ncbi:hypothetical protein OK18_03665 [Chryseobacterium gallinarum]|uniref:Uncharacterized protein n=1 Tax=Chryseobacterium gallinarum TaxID=1324352 RepID=A0A0G3LY17_CHRGL|nr:hypothetical protein [Chryseobacterium gallinarum]AKK71856.1 hypothetical protein OK18_03665 [Chryseobacterium gallinarum]MCL8535490.1 hypothetical protein [Chryseobacterium gallinarum]